MSLSLSSISELSGAASSTSDSLTSANGSVAREAVRACWMDVSLGNLVFGGWRLLTFSVFRVGAYSKLGA